MIHFRYVMYIYFRFYIFSHSRLLFKEMNFVVFPLEQGGHPRKNSFDLGTQSHRCESDVIKTQRAKFIEKWIHNSQVTIK